MKDLIEAATSGEVEAVVVFRRDKTVVRVERAYARVYGVDTAGGPTWTDYESAETLRKALNA